MLETLHNVMVGRVNIEGYKCERCGHIWVPRKYTGDKNEPEPVICPKCKSPYWNKPKASAKGKK